jgi:O-6-methylguanine DNA methyltransferase
MSNNMKVRSKKTIISKRVLAEMGRYPDFYRKVWTACASVPKGETITYVELARRIGHPGAARAVGTALSKNPFAPAIPCHRVIRNDGGMGGYSGRGGIKTKKRMLEKERTCRTGR